MDDTISRAAAIEYLMINMGWHDEDGYEVDDADEKREVITDMVNGIPAVDAIPMGWLIDRANDPERAPMYRRYAQMLYEEWQKEQEAHGT